MLNTEKFSAFSTISVNEIVEKVTKLGITMNPAKFSPFRSFHTPPQECLGIQFDLGVAEISD